MGWVVLHRTSGGGWATAYDLACSGAPYTADLQWNQVSNLKPSSPETKTLPLGQRPWLLDLQDCGKVCIIIPQGPIGNESLSDHKGQSEKEGAGLGAASLPFRPEFRITKIAGYPCASCFSPSQKSGNDAGAKRRWSTCGLGRVLWLLRERKCHASDFHPAYLGPCKTAILLT
ncbi:hypothetical protein AVEN_258699-1 [Araneus ventricosus]|uniref:Uncharacterized protein n=1 Tax=Araneus ventricosus TaxID=182803 RepID=A0A4Y2P6Y1_ARAVE|nr:hypothetical protein AVEN_258699-1 [Araneus ventricosus]